MIYTIQCTRDLYSNMLSNTHPLFAHTPRTTMSTPIRTNSTPRRRLRDLERLMDTQSHFAPVMHQHRRRLRSRKPFLAGVRTARSPAPRLVVVMLATALDRRHGDSQLVRSQPALDVVVERAERERTLAVSAACCASRCRAPWEGGGVGWIGVGAQPVAQERAQSCETAGCDAEAGFDVGPDGDLDRGICICC